MLMVLDVGNTNTVLGVYRQEELLHCWRLATERDRTADEWGILFRTLFNLGEISTGSIGAECLNLENSILNLEVSSPRFSAYRLRIESASAWSI